MLLLHISIVSIGGQAGHGMHMLAFGMFEDNKFAHHF